MSEKVHYEIENFYSEYNEDGEYIEEKFPVEDSVDGSAFSFKGLSQARFFIKKHPNLLYSNYRIIKVTTKREIN